MTSFGSGNIILGGAGSDILEGRGGDDIIDGDAWLNVQIGVYDDLAHTNLLTRHNSMTELTAAIFAGTINPGQLGIIREIRTTALDGTPIGPDFDTAKFSDVSANYEVTFEDGRWVVSHVIDGAAGPDGTDILRNIERLQFSDLAIVADGFNSEPEGFLTISDNTPTEDQLLTVSAAGITDADNVSPTNPDGAITGPISYFWQSEVRPGLFEDILIENAGGEEARATGPTFTPRELEVGLALRVRAVYKDANDVLENVFSAPTVVTGDFFVGGAGDDTWIGTNGQDIASGGGGNDTLTGLGEDDILNGNEGNDIFNYTFGDGADTVDGGVDFDSLNITGTAAADTLDVVFNGTALTNFEGGTITNVESVTADLLGDLDTLTYAGTLEASGVTVNLATGTASGFTSIANIENVTGGNGADTLTGNDGVNILNGGGGADTLDGGVGADLLYGGAGNDIMNGGAGNDIVDGQAGATRWPVVLAMSFMSPTIPWML